MRRNFSWLLVGLAALSVGCFDSAPRRLARAKDALFEKDPQRALKEYRLALDLLERDESAEAQVLRARALRGAADVYYLELRDYGHAAEVYRELIQVCPEAPETLEGRVNLAAILAQHFNDPRGAITELTAAVARNPPESAELSYRVAKLYFEVGDYPQCELESQNMVKKYETSSFVDDALFLEGQAYAMEGKREEAMRTYQDLVDRFPDSELQPYALFEMAKQTAEGGEVDKAIALYVEALKHHPDPKLVQGAITRLRRRLEKTTPPRLDTATAFDHPAVVARPKTSVEAAGGTPEEAASDRGD